MIIPTLPNYFIVFLAPFPLFILHGRTVVYSVLVCVYHSADGLACDVKHEPHGDCILLFRPDLSLVFNCACGTMKLLLLCLFPSGLSLFLFVGLFFAGCPGLSPCTRLASWFNDCVFVCPLSVLDLECLLLEWFFCLFVLCSFVNVPLLCPCSRRAAVRQPRILC